MFDVSRDGFQTLTIPVSAEYRIEIVAPGNSLTKHPGVRIIGKFELKKGQRITAALGQQGNDSWCGSGGSFLVLESDEGPKPLLIAGGAGCAWRNDEEFGRQVNHYQILSLKSLFIFYTKTLLLSTSVVEHLGTTEAM